MSKISEEIVEKMVRQAYREGQKNGGIPPFTVQTKIDDYTNRILSVLLVEQTLQGYIIWVEPTPLEAIKQTNHE